MQQVKNDHRHKGDERSKQEGMNTDTRLKNCFVV